MTNAKLKISMDLIIENNEALTSKDDLQMVSNHKKVQLLQEEGMISPEWIVIESMDPIAPDRMSDYLNHLLSRLHDIRQHQCPDAKMYFLTIPIVHYE